MPDPPFVYAAAVPLVRVLLRALPLGFELLPYVILTRVETDGLANAARMSGGSTVWSRSPKETVGTRKGGGFFFPVLQDSEPENSVGHGERLEKKKSQEKKSLKIKIWIFRYFT